VIGTIEASPTSEALSAPASKREYGRDPIVSGGGDDTIRAKLVAGAVEKPVLGVFVVLMLLMAAGFLVSFVAFVV